MGSRANRLANETSPYLLQHAHNPVDWYPWGEEAFRKARDEKRPILLSVGYSACHWCHVMERESFEDEETARLMNSLFVNVKVDREERPDVDEIYMNAVQLMTGHGGWPMTVFLTPGGEPFYGGTYFPPEDRHGLPSFRRVLGAVAEAYRDRPEKVRETTGKLVEAISGLGRGHDPSDRALSESFLEPSAAGLSRAFDPDHGGIGRAPKFPNTMVFSLFNRAAAVTGRETFREMTLTTLRHMADGGIYDHLGGGFHRYSVDERWLVPHFEKMLYDNSQLASLCLDSWRASGDERWLAVAGEILDYVRREMTSPDGGFYSTQDADSEGVEGKFFVWDRSEVLEVLGEEDGEIFCRVYDVTDLGNFEHRNILHRTLDDGQAARLFRREPGEVSRLLAAARGKLFERREQRVKPFRDEKILTSWNGLMISAFADAFASTGETRWRESAERAVRFLEENVVRDGRLLHVWKDGQARVPAFLDDVAAFALALLDLLDATSDPSYLARAEELARTLVEQFADETGGGFFFTAADAERLITRTRPAIDGSVPSGNSLAAHLFLRLHAWTDEAAYRERAEGILRAFGEGMAENPFAFANLVAAQDVYLRGATQVAVVAPGGGDGAAELLGPLRRAWDPNRIVFAYDPAAPPATIPPFARDKKLSGGRPTAYVCRGFRCSAPVTEWSALEAALAEAA